MKVLVCGGRDYFDQATVCRCLDALYRSEPIDVVVHGGASGADTLADEWAKLHGIEREPYYADWKKHGPAAGPIRNSEMLNKSKPDLVLRFPGGKGTHDMAAKAKKAGVTVVAHYDILG